MTAPVRFFQKLLGSVAGRGITANIAECYEFIINHYQPGDRIFLIGFSRGAYTVRALADLIRLSVPIAVSRMAMMLMGLTDAIVLGQFAPGELAYVLSAWLPIGVSLVMATTAGRTRLTTVLMRSSRSLNSSMLGSDGGGGEGGGSASAAAAHLCVLPSRDMTATMLRQACFICLGDQYRRYRNFWQGWPQGKLPVSLSGRPSCRSGQSLW